MRGRNTAANARIAAGAWVDVEGGICSTAGIVNGCGDSNAIARMDSWRKYPFTTERVGVPTDALVFLGYSFNELRVVDFRPQEPS